MAGMYSLKRSTSDFSLLIGRGMQYGGGFALVCMAVIGTMSIDLVILAAAEKRHNDFVTGWVLGSMFSRGEIDPVPLLIASPITSAVAVVLSVALGVPEMGALILAGWVISASILAIGIGIETFANSIDPDRIDNTQYAPRPY